MIRQRGCGILQVLLLFAISILLLSETPCFQVQIPSGFCNFQRPLHRSRQLSRLSSFRGDPAAPPRRRLPSAPKPDVPCETSLQAAGQELPLFSELGISEESKTAFARDFGFDRMTEVQAAAIGPMLEGKDVIVRAKTGTGKTMGFLLPMVEAICKPCHGLSLGRAPKGCISALILSPTRELAAQIAKEAEVLLTYHDLNVVCIYGGVGKIQKDLNKLARCDILVATPGRLQDHLDNTPGFKQRLSKLKFLTLDEADNLLEMGFKAALMRIFQSLPPADLRRTALFSATFPPNLDELGKLALRPDSLYINTVKADEEVTPDQIDQSVISSDLKGMTTLLWQVLDYERASSSESKIIVFFNTANNAAFFSQQFGAAGLDIREVHSRKSQTHRTKQSELFRKSKTAIMFTSDVSARGVDYPGVTAVIQVGAASTTDQYIHRIGRTGRAGKSGRCLLLLHDFESYFLRLLAKKGLPVKKLAQASFSDAPPPAQLNKPLTMESASKAYKAWLGYHNGQLKNLGWTKSELVKKATEYAESIGASQNGLPPPLERRTVGKMGLKKVPGLNLM